jgi:hypothetical protein
MTTCKYIYVTTQARTLLASLFQHRQLQISQRKLGYEKLRAMDIAQQVDVQAQDMLITENDGVL